jgi:hypothetical protein
MNTTLDVAEPMPMPAIHQELAPQISPEAERPHVRRLREALQLALILLFEISVGLEPSTPALPSTVFADFAGFAAVRRRSFAPICVHVAPQLLHISRGAVVIGGHRAVTQRSRRGQLIRAGS